MPSSVQLWDFVSEQLDKTSANRFEAFAVSDEQTKQELISDEGNGHGDQGVRGDIGFRVDEAAAETPWVTCGSITQQHQRGVKKNTEFDKKRNKYEPNTSNLEYHPPDSNTSQRHSLNPCLGTIDLPQTDELQLVAPLEWMEDPESEDEEAGTEINAAEEECEMDVALDTGCVAHCAGPKNLPSATKVLKPAGVKLKNFIAANNTPIENYGVAHVVMEMADGAEVGGSFQVAGVGRALHSASVVCDTGSRSCPDGHEILTTKRGAVVVPDAALSRYLASVRHVAKYPRRGGLYVAKVKVRTPAAADARRAANKKPPAPAKKAGFGRRSSTR